MKCCLYLPTDSCWFLSILVDIFHLNNDIKMSLDNIDIMHKKKQKSRSFFQRRCFLCKRCSFLLISADSLNMVYKLVFRFHCTVEWKSDFFRFFPQMSIIGFETIWFVPQTHYGQNYQILSKKYDGFFLTRSWCMI